MGDTLGLLTLPTLGGGSGSAAAGDPLLDVLLAYLQAVINARTKAAYKTICPFKTPGTAGADPLPVAFTYAHNPTDECISTGRLPALFAWRTQPHATRTTRTQGWLIRESAIAVLWVPLRATQEQARIREPFRNAVSAAIDLALLRGRDPAWKVAGDTYYGAQTYGSTFAREAKLWSQRVRQIAPHPIQIDFDRGPRVPFDALLAEIDVKEILASSLDDFAALAQLSGTASTNGKGTLPFIFRVSVDGVAPASGPAAGGTTLTLTGKQFQRTLDDPTQPLSYTLPTVTVDGAECTDVAWVAESTLTASTPAHDAGGPFDVVVTNPSGASATAASAFTYV